MTPTLRGRSDLDNAIWWNSLPPSQSVSRMCIRGNSSNSSSIRDST